MAERPIDRYAERASLLEKFKPHVEQIFEALLHEAGIPAHVVQCRVKRKDSVERKLMRPDLQGILLEDLPDFLGARVITFFTDHVQAVTKLIEANFIVHDQRPDKREREPDRFGYLALHRIVSLDDEHAGIEARRFVGVKFEVQIKTILQHAWAETEHPLGYKADGAIPPAFRRRFSIAAAMLEGVDLEFLRLRDELKQYREKVEQLEPAQAGALPIDQVSLVNLARTSTLGQKLDRRIAELTAAELRTSDFYVGHRARDLEDLGLSKVADVEASLRKHEKLITGLAQLWLTEAAHDALYEGVSLHLLAVIIAADQGGEDGLRRYFIRNRITEDRAGELAQKILAFLGQLG